MSSTVATIVASVAIITTNAHSWVRCTDYAAEITGGDYDESQCNGWIRDWSFDGITFAQDRGINFQTQIGVGSAICGSNVLDGSADSDYSSDYANSDKLATYIAGSTVRVVWPAKNHANYECFSNIPDNGMKLFMNPNTNPSADISNTGSTSMEGQGYRLVKDWQEGCTAGSDGCGFQNCPKFCEGTDAATCYGDFVVPDDVESGYYTFVWYWIFNNGATPYISCWEAYIDASGDSTPTTPDEPSSGGSNSGKLIDGYLTWMPVCITGQTYDENTVLGFVALQFDEVATRDELSIIGVEDGGSDGYNFTAQISHESSQSQAITTVAGEFCDDFQTFYGSGSCEVCSDIVTFAVYKDAACCKNTHYFVIAVLVFVLSLLF